MELWNKFDVLFFCEKKAKKLWSVHFDRDQFSRLKPRFLKSYLSTFLNVRRDWYFVSVARYFKTVNRFLRRIYSVKQNTEKFKSGWFDRRLKR